MTVLTRLRSARRTTLLVAATVLVVLLAVGGYFLVSAFSGPSSPGEVTFAAGAASASTDASQYCDVGVTECGSDPTASAVLKVPAGTSLQVTVPDAVAATPWQVAFTFRDAAGAQQQGRTPVFPPGARSTFTLAVPGTPPGQLESAEVQQYGAKLSQGPDGLQFSTRSTWVLSVDDR